MSAVRRLRVTGETSPWDGLTVGTTTDVRRGAPLVGWRFWGANGGAGFSYFGKRYGALMVTALDTHDRAEMERWDSRLARRAACRRSLHPAPAAGCGCGYNVVRDLDVLIDYMRWFTRGGWRDVGDLLAVCRVRGWGRAMLSDERSDPPGTARTEWLAVGPGDVICLSPAASPAARYFRAVFGADVQTSDATSVPTWLDELEDVTDGAVA